MSTSSPSGRWRFSALRSPRVRFLAGLLALALVVVGITAIASGRSGPQAAFTATSTTVATGPGGEPEFVTVRRQALRSTLQLRARTATGQVGVATPEGMATTLLVSVGSPVVAGQPVARFDPPAQSLGDAQRKAEDARLALRQALAEAGVPEASATATFALEQARLTADRAEADLRALRNSAGVVDAPSDGTLVQLPSGALSITSGRVVQAELRPLQLLRLRSGAMSGTANVETVTGLRMVPCLGITLSEGSGGTSEAGGVGDAGAEVAGVASCALEGDVETVDGLNATIEVEISLGEDVLVVPALAVAYDDDGSPFVLRRTDGRSERVGVSLGASDGVLRVVEGLQEGDQVQLEPSAGDQP